MSLHSWLPWRCGWTFGLSCFNRGDEWGCCPNAPSPGRDTACAWRTEFPGTWPVSQDTVSTLWCAAFLTNLVSGLHRGDGGNTERLGEGGCERIVGSPGWDVILWKLKIQSQLLSRRVIGSGFFFFSFYFSQFGKPGGLLSIVPECFNSATFNGCDLSIKKVEHQRRWMWGLLITVPCWSTFRLPLGLQAATAQWLDLAEKLKPVCHLEIIYFEVWRST